MARYQVMPDLAADEYQNLKDDIALNGVQVPGLRVGTDEEDRSEATDYVIQIVLKNGSNVACRVRFDTHWILFSGAKLVSLLEFLADPSVTYDDAARKFKCSPSTIEKTVARIRAEAQSSEGTA